MRNIGILLCALACSKCETFAQGYKNPVIPPSSGAVQYGTWRADQHAETETCGGGP